MKRGLQPDNDGDPDSSSEQDPRISAGPVSANDAMNDNEATEGIAAGPSGPSPAVSQADDIQILDLHGQNPVISYQNQIYYCTWSDMIGTAMFFSKAEAGTEEAALMSTNDFHLINTSRIKLLGQKAKLAGKPGRKRRRPLDDNSSYAICAGIESEDDNSLANGKGLGEIRTSNPKTNADIKRQAAFLERLMDVKRAKGESDNVRTVFSRRKGNSKITQPRGVDAGGSRLQRVFSSLEKEIEELNRRVVRGDATALMRLQEIYSSMEDDAQNGPSCQQNLMATSQTPTDGIANA